MNYGISRAAENIEQFNTSFVAVNTVEQLEAATPADQMLAIFAEAGATHPEPLFYGIPMSEYANRLRAIRFVNGQN